MQQWNLVGAAAGSLAIASGSFAEFIVHEGTGSTWFTAVGAWSTIAFTELPNATPLSEQYASLGVHFIDVDAEGDWTWHTPSFTLDGAGLYGGPLVELQFDSPMAAFASHFPGVTYFDFYAGDNLLFHSTHMGGSGTGFFAGFSTNTPFDRIRMYGLPPGPSGADNIYLDNFYFATVPAPGGVAVMLAGVFRRSRRR